IGLTKNEMGGSHFYRINQSLGGRVPQVDLELAPRIFSKIHRAIQQGLIRSCHDLSEGGLAVALAEMAFAGEVGADVTALPGGLPDAVALFSESGTRFIVEVVPEKEAALREVLGAVPLTKLGVTVKEQRLRIVG